MKHIYFAEVSIMILAMSDLRGREVVRVCDAQTLGCVCDVTLDTCTGHLCALYVMPFDLGIGDLWRGDVMIVPWDRVECIGDSCILVNMSREACTVCSQRGRKRKKKRDESDNCK